MSTQRVLSFAVGLALLQSCASARAPLTQQPTEKYLTVMVVNSANTSMLVPDVDIIAVTGDGSFLHIGRTDSAGAIRLSKATLRARGISVVLFCHRYFFCGALIVADRKLFDFDEYVIALSPVTVH